jgi:hypothetical protein
MSKTKFAGICIPDDTTSLNEEKILLCIICIKMLIKSLEMKRDFHELNQKKIQ